jgi:hypothetical protein
MVDKKREIFVIHELNSLSESIIDMEDFKEDIVHWIFSRSGVFSLYSKLMKTSNDIIRVLTNNWHIVPDHMSQNVSQAIAYTKAVQWDIFREMCKSPASHRHILGMTSDYWKLDDKIFSYICCLERLHLQTLAVQRGQNMRENITYDIDAIQMFINDTFKTLEKAAWIWADDVCIIMENNRGNIDTWFTNQTYTITQNAIRPFLSVIKTHILRLQNSVEHAIQGSVAWDRPRAERDIFDMYSNFILDLKDCIHRDITYLAGEEPDMDIAEQISILLSHIDHFFFLKKSYDKLTEPFISRPSNALYIWQQSTWRV